MTSAEFNELFIKSSKVGDIGKEQLISRIEEFIRANRQHDIAVNASDFSRALRLVTNELITANRDHNYPLAQSVLLAIEQRLEHIGAISPQPQDSDEMENPLFDERGTVPAAQYAAANAQIDSLESEIRVHYGYGKEAYDMLKQIVKDNYGDMWEGLHMVVSNGALLYEETNGEADE